MLGFNSNNHFISQIRRSVISKRHFFFFCLLIPLSQACISSILDEVKKIDAIDEVVTNTYHSIPLVHSDLQSTRFFLGMDTETFKNMGGEMFITSSVDINPRNLDAPYDLNAGQTVYSQRFDYRPKYSRRAKDAITRSATFNGTERDTTEVFIPLTYKDMSEVDSLWLISTAIRVKFESPYSQLEGDINLSFESIKGRNSRAVAKGDLTFPLGRNTVDEVMIFNNQVFTPILNAGVPSLKLKIISRLSFQGQQNMHDSPFRITIDRDTEIVNKMFGKIKKKTFTLPTRYKIDFTKLKESIKRIQNVFDVDFSRPYLKLDMSSNYGINIAIDFKNIKVYNSGKAASLAGALSSDPFQMEFLSNDQGVLVDKEKEFLSTNSNINSILARLPDSIVMIVAGEIYPAAQNFQKENFASDQILRGKLEVRFPFVGVWRKVELKGTTPYKPITEDRGTQASIDSIKLFTTVSNQLPVPVQMSIFLLDSEQNRIIKILDNQLLDPAQIDRTTGRALSARSSIFLTSISGTDIDTYKKSRYVNVISILSQNSDLRPVYIESAQRVRISLKASFFMKSIKL